MGGCATEAAEVREGAWNRVMVRNDRNWVSLVAFQIPDLNSLPSMFSVTSVANFPVTSVADSDDV